MKMALVTGGTRGIGRGIALRLARDGFALALNYLSDDVEAAATAEECSELTEVLLVRADVSRRPEVDRLIADSVGRFGRIDVLVNNASCNIDRPFLALSDEEWDIVINTNLKSVFMCSQSAARIMKNQPGGGNILNIGATTAIRGRVNGANYCSAKAGVLVLTKCLALELAPEIRVNCVIPGSTRVRSHGEEERIRAKEKSIPLRRVGTPADVANAVSFLASSEASYISGQKLIVDGGQFMY